jgi:ketosteroid isomerase-like protein
MASANLDLVRSIWADWERADWSSTEWADPEIEFVFAGEGPESGVWTGVAGIAAGWRRWISEWEELRVAAYEYHELDDERILVFNTFTGRGKTSGLELGQIRAKGASLFHICDGKVTKLVLYGDLKSAFADLGLAPEAGPPPS